MTYDIEKCVKESLEDFEKFRELASPNYSWDSISFDVYKHGVAHFVVKPHKANPANKHEVYLIKGDRIINTDFGDAQGLFPIHRSEGFGANGSPQTN